MSESNPLTNPLTSSVRFTDYIRDKSLLDRKTNPQADYIAAALGISHGEHGKVLRTTLATYIEELGKENLTPPQREEMARLLSQTLAMAAKVGRGEISPRSANAAEGQGRE